MKTIFIFTSTDDNIFVVLAPTEEEAWSKFLNCPDLECMTIEEAETLYDVVEATLIE